MSIFRILDSRDTLICECLVIKLFIVFLFSRCAEHCFRKPTITNILLRSLYLVTNSADAFDVGLVLLTNTSLSLTQSLVRRLLSSCMLENRFFLREAFFRLSISSFDFCVCRYMWRVALPSSRSRANPSPASAGRTTTAVCLWPPTVTCTPCVWRKSFPASNWAPRSTCTSACDGSDRRPSTNCPYPCICAALSDALGITQSR